MERANPTQATSMLLTSFATYEEAQEAVDRLADQKFPVEEVGIVAHDLQMVENVVGRRGYAEAGLGGLVSGLIVGGLVGFLLALFGFDDPIASVFPMVFQGAAVGAPIGLAIGLIGQWGWAGRRDFASVKSLRAGRYELRVAPAFAESAREVLLAAGLVRAG